MNMKHTYLALVLGAGLAHAGIANTLILDDFDSDPNDDLGGVASYSTIILSNPFNQSADFSLDTLMSTGSDTGALIFNSGIGVEQLGTVVYNNEGAGLDLDAAGLGVHGFELDFALVDLNFFAQLTLFTYDDMGNAIGSATQLIQIGAGTDMTGEWSLADFSVADAFDASNVDEVRLTLNVRNFPTASLDFIATEFRAVVPPPGSVALLGLGGLVIARRGRD